MICVVGALVCSNLFTPLPTSPSLSLFLSFSLSLSLSLSLSSASLSLSHVWNMAVETDAFRWQRSHDSEWQISTTSIMTRCLTRAYHAPAVVCRRRSPAALLVLDLRCDPLPPSILEGTLNLGRQFRHGIKGRLWIDPPRVKIRHCLERACVARVGLRLAVLWV